MANRTLLICLLSAALAVWVIPAAALTTNFVNGTPKLVKVEKGHSRLVKLPAVPKRVSIADNNVADVLVIAPDQIYINGRSVGKTNITVWGNKNTVMANYHVQVGRNLTLLKKMLHKLMPNERVEVHEMEGVVVLSGRVSTKEAKLQAESLASIFSSSNAVKAPKAPQQKAAATQKSSKDKMDPATMLANAFSEAVGAKKDKKAESTVRNLIEVGDQKQVLIKLKFAEVNKGALKRHGINLGALGNFGYLYTFLGGGLVPNAPNPYDTFMPFDAIPSRNSTAGFGGDFGDTKIWVSSTS